MELRDYLRLYWKQRRLLLTVIVVAAAVAYVTAATRPVRYAASESFAVNRINQESTADYQYDGYYALQAADLFSQTVVSWFSTPSVLTEMYAAAKVDPEITAVNTLARRFKVKRYSAQNIVVRFSERNEDRATRVVAAVRRVMEDKAARLNQTSGGKALFEIIGTAPVIAPVRPNAWLMAGLAAAVALFAGLLLVAGREYLRE